MSLSGVKAQPLDIGVVRWLTKPEAAAYTQMHERTIDRYRKAGDLRAYRIGPREIRFKIEDLDALLEPLDPTAGGEPHEAA